MRTSLTHARDALGLIGAVTLILYIVVVPHRPESVDPDASLRTVAIDQAEMALSESHRVAEVIPEVQP